MSAIWGREEGFHLQTACCSLELVRLWTFGFEVCRARGKNQGWGLGIRRLGCQLLSS